MTCGEIERKGGETAVRYGLYIVRMSLHQEKELKNKWQRRSEKMRIDEYMAMRSEAYVAMKSTGRETAINDDIS